MHRATEATGRTNCYITIAMCLKPSGVNCEKGLNVRLWGPENCGPYKLNRRSLYIGDRVISGLFAIE